MAMMPRRSSGPEVLQFEEIAQKPPRTLRDDDGIGRGDALQAGREIWRLAHDPPFLGLPGADKITDHDQAGRDPDADLKRLSDAQLADRLDERQSRPNRAFGIVLVRLRITEIDKYAVAHVLGHEAIEPGDHLRDAFVIGPDHKAHVLGVELSRERRRANEVGEHDSQLAALGVIPWLGWGAAG